MTVRSWVEQAFDGGDQFLPDFARFDFARNVVVVVLERIDERDFVAALVRQEFFEGEHGRCRARAG